MSAPLVFYFDVISPTPTSPGRRSTPCRAPRPRCRARAHPLRGAPQRLWPYKGPAEIPPKRVYIFKDVLRSAARLGVPLAPPPAHPFNPLLALRVASVPMPQDRQRALIHALYRATWGGGGGVESTPRVAAAIAEVGLDPEATIREATSEVGKARVRARTEERWRAASSESPRSGPMAEIFWGLDALGHLDRFLAGQDPIDPAALARWSSLPSSASRISRRIGSLRWA